MGGGEGEISGDAARRFVGVVGEECEVVATEGKGRVHYIAKSLCLFIEGLGYEKRVGGTDQRTRQRVSMRASSQSGKARQECCYCLHFYFLFLSLVFLYNAHNQHDTHRHGRGPCFVGRFSFVLVTAVRLSVVLLSSVFSTLRCPLFLSWKTKDMIPPLHRQHKLRFYVFHSFP